MKCFVIMPFGNPEIDAKKATEFDHVYNEWIKPAVESICIFPPDGNLQCLRADEDQRSGQIIMHIIEQLHSADIVIADLSGRNANVFYELGVRHALGKKTILITDDLENIPFDLRGLRAIDYKFDPVCLVAFRNKLIERLRHQLTEANEEDNPVSDFLLRSELQRIKTKETVPGYDVIAHLTSKIDELKKSFESQADDTRRLVEQIVSQKPQQIIAAEGKQLEGIWRATPSNSLIAVRLINGRLYAPYCYGGDACLTGHYKDFQRIGDTFFARFEWFHNNFSGYGMFRILSANKVSGGWWFSEDVPESIRRGTQLVDVTLPRMNSITLTKNKKKKAPKWAEEYFKDVEKSISLS
jgi:nucleoside 2-deoxyribosyltransferase